MKMFISEVLDRLSILKLKSERSDVDVNDEINAYSTYADEYGNYVNYLDRLKEVNGKIWDLESDIRRGKENELGLEEVGRRAIKIRNLNGKRIAIKNEISKKYNEGFIEKKVNHASE